MTGDYLFVDRIDQLAVRDGQPPLDVLGQQQVFREQGGADYTVTAVSAVDRRTGEYLTFHVASVKDGQPGAVCVAMLPGDSHRDGSTPANEEPYLLLARHWRVSTGAWAWEFPRGMGEPGESPEQTAVRELCEETGLKADAAHARVLQTMHADTGVLRDVIAIVTIDLPAAASTAGAAPRTDWELSNLRWVHLSAVRQMVAAGLISDGITLAALMVVEARHAAA